MLEVGKLYRRIYPYTTRCFLTYEDLQNSYYKFFSAKKIAAKLEKNDIIVVLELKPLTAQQLLMVTSATHAMKCLTPNGSIGWCICDKTGWEKI
jgi:hypothetical protein